MLLGAKKRTRVSDEELDSSNETVEVFSDVLVSVKNKGKENAGKIMQKVQKDLKRMRLDLDLDNSRMISSEFFNSSSESSPRTPSSHADTSEYSSSSYSYHQMHQHQKQQSLDDTSLSNPNTHKLYRNPIRISTRSEASSSSSSTELLNPYVNINSVLYLANLMRTSHIVNELQDDLGCMEIDERADTHINGRKRLIGNGAAASSMDDDSVNLGLGQFQNDGYGSSEMMPGYQSINAVLREAFLRRHRNMDVQI